MFESKKVEKNNNKISDRKSRNWLCTLNNPGELTLEAVHAMTKATYTVGQLERGQNGTLHFQFYQNYKISQRLSHYKNTLPAAHAEPVIVDNGAAKYCMKEDTRVEGPWEYGTKPIQRNSKTDWEEVYTNAKRGRLEDIPADVRVRCYSQLKKIEKDHLVVKDCDRLRGVWIYGPSGVGKSRSARRDYPDAYPKLCNKWWDGYQGQKNVIMDDIGPEHKVLAQQLKIWSDRYGCILETKGGALTSTYENFVVTSQYSIEEIFAGDQPTIDALRRRFKVIHIPWNLYNPKDNVDSNPFSLDDFVDDHLVLEKKLELSLVEHEP